jgi:hypothetical protein
MRKRCATPAIARQAHFGGRSRVTGITEKVVLQGLPLRLDGTILKLDHPGHLEAKAIIEGEGQEGVAAHTATLHLELRRRRRWTLLTRPTFRPLPRLLKRSLKLKRLDRRTLALLNEYEIRTRKALVGTRSSFSRVNKNTRQMNPAQSVSTNGHGTFIYAISRDLIAIQAL